MSEDQMHLDFTAPRLSGSNHQNLQLANINLSGSTVKDADFYQCTFNHVICSEAALIGCSFEACRFEDSDLSLAKLNGAGFQGVTFRNCKLMGINWTQARKALQVSFDGCILDYCSFVGVTLSRTTFHECRLREANFSEADLRLSDFSGSDLTGARFNATNLAGANLVTAVGYLLSPATNKVKGARFSLEGAVMLAQLFGIRVEGFDDTD